MVGSLVCLVREIFLKLFFRVFRVATLGKFFVWARQESLHVTRDHTFPTRCVG